ncbi:MAG TPA: hypothetical protein VD999_01750 [Vitreimonas sp.]|nr:hypothetical protein [Vitreimonas sp.]
MPKERLKRKRSRTEVETSWLTPSRILKTLGVLGGVGAALVIGRQELRSDHSQTSTSNNSETHSQTLDQPSRFELSSLFSSEADRQLILNSSVHLLIYDQNGSSIGQARGGLAIDTSSNQVVLLAAAHSIKPEYTYQLTGPALSADLTVNGTAFTIDSPQFQESTARLIMETGQVSTVDLPVIAPETKLLTTESFVTVPYADRDTVGNVFQVTEITGDGVIVWRTIEWDMVARQPQLGDWQAAPNSTQVLGESCNGGSGAVALLTESTANGFQLVRNNLGEALALATLAGNDPLNPTAEYRKGELSCSNLALGLLIGH